MLTQMQQINPTELLHQTYNPINKNELAELLGVSYSTVCSWIERRRNPSKTARILAAILLNQWRSHPK